MTPSVTFPQAPASVRPRHAGGSDPLAAGFGRQLAHAAAKRSGAQATPPKAAPRPDVADAAPVAPAEQPSDREPRHAEAAETDAQVAPAQGTAEDGSDRRQPTASDGKQAAVATPVNTAASKAPVAAKAVPTETPTLTAEGEANGSGASFGQSSPGADTLPATGSMPGAAAQADAGPKTAGHPDSAGQKGATAKLPMISGASVETASAPAAAPTSATTSPTATAPPSPALPQLEQTAVDANVARVARGLQSALSQQGGTVALRLHPPELGVVRIEVQIDAGVVRVRFHAEHESIRTLLTHQLQHLRQTLEGHGLVVERLDVQTQTQAQREYDDSQSWREDAADGRSRGQRGFFRRPPPGHTQDDPNSLRSDPLSFEQALLNMVG